MLTSTARYIARELRYDADREEVLHFGLQLVTNFLANLFLLASIGYLLGTLSTTLFAALVAGALKVFAGGAHASSSRTCVIIGTLYFAPAGWIAARWGPELSPLAAWLLLAAVSGAALWAFWRYAPAESPEKPLASRVQREKMRVASFGSLTLVSLVIVALGIAGWRVPAAGEALRALFTAGVTGLSWQALILTPAGYRVAALGDGVLDLLMKGGDKK